MEITSLFELIAFLLLVLAGCSGIVLFYRAAFSPKESGGMDTLWSLFLVGLIGGIVLILGVHGCHR
jgi:peptidoglycan biosynthesis protein MviN/MurJ (putative lipid II flippase)